MIYLCDENRHLVCYPFSVENLHKMAEDLGIHRAWYHSGNNPHYDIPIKRINEVKLKCVLVDSKTIVKIIKGEFFHE